MSEVKKVFYMLAAFPALLLVTGWLYTEVYGEPAGYEGMILMANIYLSFVLGCAGIAFIVYSRRRKEPVLGLIIATFAASFVFLWYGARLISFALRPLQIGLGS